MPTHPLIDPRGSSVRGTRRRRALGAVLALAAAAACSPSDHVDLVHDLRILGVKANPPNVVIPLIPLPDGGAILVPERGVDAGNPLGPIAITALVADPQGGGRSIHYQFQVCAQLDSTTHRCLASSPDVATLATGDVVPPDQVSTEITAVLMPTERLLADTLALDPYRGIDGLNVPIDLAVSASSPDGGGQDEGVKLMVFTFPTLAALASGSDAGLPTPFTNPTLADLAVNGTLWDPADAGLTLDGSLLTQPSGPGVRVGGGGGASTQTSSSAFQFYPVPALDPNLAYSLPTFTGGTVQLEESWRYHFYGTAGTFSPATSGGFSANFNVNNPIDSFWAPDKNAPAEDVWFWVVVDDGRGGTDWLYRHGNYVP